ncbi:MAG: polysaccharide biosynthesis/export family protein [Fimbriimonadaceae bacterium]
MKWLLFILLVLASIGASAQTQGTYRLQPDDLISIRIYREDIGNDAIPVGRDGNISAPFIGTVRAQGKTTSELAAELEGLYRQKLSLRDPRVSVSILRFRAIRATISGAVKAPGVRDLRPGDTILTLLASGGGANSDLGPDMRRATLRRSDSNELIPVDLYSMLVFADTSQNYEIQDGDELNIPEKRKPTISVLGMVPQPGSYGFREGMTVMDALSIARFEVKTRSQLSKTMVLRDMPGRPGEIMRIQVDIVRFIREGDASQNITLQSGDLVWVPETRSPDINALSGIAGLLFTLDRVFGSGGIGSGIFGR